MVYPVDMWRSKRRSEAGLRGRPQPAEPTLRLRPGKTRESGLSPPSSETWIALLLMGVIAFCVLYSVISQ